MAQVERTKPRCFVAIPYTAQFDAVRLAVNKAVSEAQFRAVGRDDVRAVAMGESPVGELARADCIIADLTTNDPNILFDLGLAQAMGKGLFLLAQGEMSASVPVDLRGFPQISYSPSRAGLAEVTQRLASALSDYRKAPRRARYIPGARLNTPFFVDWDRLDPSEAENLFRELLAQLGYQQLDWDQGLDLIDLVAELPRKDPDGFEYRELWLVAMGRRGPLGALLQMAMEPEYLAHRLFRQHQQVDRLVARGGASAPATLLVISLKEEESVELNQAVRDLNRASKHRAPVALRVRIWDRKYLTSLVQQFPQIGYKYFSDEARFRSKYRKAPEELYQENVQLVNRMASLIADLEAEKNMRVRAERDAVWKDISFSAAHKIGNPIFAIETNLDPLQRRVAERRTDDALEVISDIRASVERAKSIVDQFKSLTRAQKITRIPTLLRPILEDSCRAAKNYDCVCEIDCPADLLVLGDPDRLAECFDELISNATNWFTKPDKRIWLTASEPASPPLPQSLDASVRYALIHVRDNGPGVPLENKVRIFDAFFTTRSHGTGLGLAVVRRIIEGHDGLIIETGRPGDGADFQIYLPTATVSARKSTKVLAAEESPRAPSKRAGRK